VRSLGKSFSRIGTLQEEEGKTKHKGRKRAGTVGFVDPLPPSHLLDYVTLPIELLNLIVQYIPITFPFDERKSENELKYSKHGMKVTKRDSSPDVSFAVSKINLHSNFPAGIAIFKFKILEKSDEMWLGISETMDLAQEELLQNADSDSVFMFADGSRQGRRRFPCHKTKETECKPVQGLSSIAPYGKGDVVGFELDVSGGVLKVSVNGQLQSICQTLPTKRKWTVFAILDAIHDSVQLID